MPKPSKSSATSGTRKKHARKAGNEEQPEPQQTTKSKPTKKQIKKGLAPPPKKSYIPPSKLKPTAHEIDPLDGIDSLLPSELVLILRKFSKKDAITKTRALEELENWIRDDSHWSIRPDSLINMLPVWLYRYPALTVHPSRRIRDLAAIIQALLINLPHVKSEIVAFVDHQGSESDITRVLGCWCLSRWDVDKYIASQARTSWDRTIRLEGPKRIAEEDVDKTLYVYLNTSRMASDLLPFLITCVMDPSATFLALYPSSSNPPPPNFRGNHSHLKVPAVSKATGEPRGEEEQEPLEDRNARIRTSALHALGWILSTSQPSAPLKTVLQPLFRSPAFWTVLYHGHVVPYLPNQDEDDPPTHFGADQPAVRRAGWSVINSLLADPGLPRFLGWINENDLEHAISGDNSTMKLISCVVLRSAFVEPDPLVRSTMWQPFLVYLTKVIDAWRLCSNHERSHGVSFNTDSGNESDDEASNDRLSVSAAYAEFQSFLSLGCNGSPAQGYPTILVILSTIPSEILPFTVDALSGFFDCLWSAVDGQALGSLSSERVKATHAFVIAWSECLLWVIGRLIKGSPRDQSSHRVEDDAFQQAEAAMETAKILVDQQFKRFSLELWNGLRVDAAEVGRLISGTLRKLELIATDLQHIAWSHLVDRMQQVLRTLDERILEQMISFLATLHRHSTTSSVIRLNIQNFVTVTSIDAVSAWSDVIQKGSPVNTEKSVIDIYGRLLQLLLECFGEILKAEASFVEALNNLAITWPIAFVSQPSLVLAYLKYGDSEQRDVVWNSILRTLESSSLLPFQKKTTLLETFIHSDQKTLQTLNEPGGHEVANLAEQVLDEALTGNESALGLITTLLCHPKPFISMDSVRGLISSSVATLDYQLQLMIEGSTPSIEILTSSLNLLLGLGDSLPVDDLPAPIQEKTLPHLFIHGFTLPECGPFEEQEEEAMELSTRLWESWQARAKGNVQDIVLQNTKRCLKSLITDTRSRPQPVSILRSLKSLVPNSVETSLLAVLPTQDELSNLLSSTPTGPIDDSLAVLDFFAFCSDAPEGQLSEYDHFGFSPYCRGVKAWIHVMLADRQIARANIWALQHILTLGHFATEILRIPHIRHPVFSTERVTVTELKEVVEASRRIAAYILASAGESSSWHSEVIQALSGKKNLEKLDSVGQFVFSLFGQLQQTETYRESAVLYTVLQHVLPNADKMDVDGWVDIARQIEPRAFKTSLVISRAVSEFAPESSRLDRYRNEIASKLSAVPPSKANSNGLRLLRSLAAVAPRIESDVIFLPQQRAVYVVQTLQSWFGSDEDIDEAVERDATLIVYYLAPLIQSIQGSHWEFVLDLLESNLENCSFEDNRSLVLLARSLQLAELILDLTKSTKYLRGVWNERSNQIFGLVRNLLETPTGFLQGTPVSTCREYALAILQELPSSLMNEDTLSNMCHLLKDSSIENQKLAYFLLQQAAVKRTEHLVIEAAVETPDSDTTTEVLPPGILASIQTNVGLEGTNIKNEEALSYLLAWLLCFDLFIDASHKVKTAYVDHMRRLDLIGLYFLPNIFGILNVADSNKVFKLDPWVIDEYWLPMYDADAPYSLQSLAAHVYYRGLLTVPSLIRTWWEGLKDRQLSSAIASYTSMYFSPVLVASEFVHVKPSTRAEAGEEPLGDDTFKIKVAHATNEVTASFLVDEQHMEIGVKLPNGYPLRTVEVRPIKKVGVNDKIWRRWLFAVQQVMTTQNGRIADGLALFKKTASLHFEGQAECAICYSILHVVDHSLPTKPCRTCKNRFHAGCLYKWFNTSHSSSCPLCRSDIM